MKIKRIIYFALTIIMAVIIFGFSSQSSEDSNNLSYQIDIKIYNLIKNMTTETNGTSAENTIVSSDDLTKVEKNTNKTQNEIANTTTKSSKTKSTKNSIYPTKDKLFHNIDVVVRKTAHVTLYALFAVFLALFIKTFKIKSWKIVLIVLTVGFLYACLDEYNQKLGGTRTGKFKDSLIDTGGCLIGVTLVLLVQGVNLKIKTRKANKNEENKVEDNK